MKPRKIQKGLRKKSSPSTDTNSGNSLFLFSLVSMHIGFPDSSTGKESTCNAGDPGLIPGSGRCSGEGNSYPLQYSGLENSMDCIGHGVEKSRTRLSNFHFQFIYIYFTTNIVYGFISDSFT